MWLLEKNSPLADIGLTLCPPEAIISSIQGATYNTYRRKFWCWVIDKIKKRAIFYICFSFSFPGSYFYPFGSAVGDTQHPAVDDACSVTHHHPLTVFGQTYDTFYVSRLLCYLWAFPRPGYGKITNFASDIWEYARASPLRNQSTRLF